MAQPTQPTSLSHPPVPATSAAARRAGPPESDTPMTATYVRVIAVEVAIVIALWFFGRAFS